MTFVIKKIATATVDVAIQVPGEQDTSTVQATWRLHAWDDFQARMEQMKAGKLTDEQLVEEDLHELAGVKDEQGKDLPLSPELAADLLQIGYVRRPLIASWYDAQMGRNQAAAKN